MTDAPKLNEAAAHGLDAVTRAVLSASFEAVKLTYQSESWRELGFASFEAWAGSMPKYRLPRDERLSLVTELDGIGMTQRQIAAAVGTGVATVNRTLAVPNGTGLESNPVQDREPAVPNGTNRLAPLMSSESPEWYTPRHIVDAVVATLGSIDLDPCSNPGEPNVPAGTHYTTADDGLRYGWSGRVYMNPPYGRLIDDWVAKLAVEWEEHNVTEAVALVPARTDTGWFRRLPAETVCFITGRLAFSESETSAPFPSVALYLGERPERFMDAFGPLGLVYRRWR